MRMIRRLATAIPIAVLALAAGTMFHADVSAQAAGPTVLVGAGELGYAVNLFGGGNLTVRTGTTVTFKANWLEPHTVTFSAGAPIPPPSDSKAPVPSNPGVPVQSYDGTKYLSSGFII